MTAIEWTDATWNPTTGCDRVSPGCDHCYALTLAARLKGMGSPKYQNDGDPRTSGPGFGVTTHETALTAPLRWGSPRMGSPRMVFVNSMSDLFHARVPTEFVVRVFAVMAATPQHTYQILTKRPGRARRFLRDECRCGQGHGSGVHLRSRMEWAATSHSPTHVPGLDSGLFHRMEWPLPNVWLGVSTEDQEQADRRIHELERTPTAVRFISAEPLLGEILLGDRLRHLDWVIAGGESGTGARPMHPDWARSLRDQCVSAAVPFHFKQWGGRTPKSGGRELDGRTWDEFPAVAP